MKTLTGAPQLGQGPETVLKYCHTENAAAAPKGSKMESAKNPFKMLNKNPPSGEKTKAANSPKPTTLERTLDSSLLFRPGGRLKDMASFVVEEDDGLRPLVVVILVG